MAGGSCLLGSFNLGAFVDKPFTDEASVNMEELEKAVTIAVRALNDVLDYGIDLHPLEIQRENAKNWRQIGLGTLGISDMFIKLGIRYGSQESIDCIDKVFSLISTTAFKASVQLGEELGSFPNFNKQAIKASNFYQAVLNDIEFNALRNSQLLTVAPTGSLATMIAASSGIEPHFALSYNRRTVSLNETEEIYKVEAKIVQEYREATGNLTGELPDYFITAGELDWKERIKVQGTVQDYIDASISSTINLKESTTVDEVANIYIEAWKHGLKGVTIWRDNCDRQGILTTDNKKEEPVEDEQPGILKRGEIEAPSDNYLGLKRTITTGCGTLHVNAYIDKETKQLKELYLSKGSTGGCAQFMVGLSRMVSLAARGGISTEAILDQLKSCGTCPSYAVRRATKKDTSPGACCPSAIANAIKDIMAQINDEEIIIKKPEIQLTYLKDEPQLGICPECKTKGLVASNGCGTCINCGFSKCS
jgi:ribonucleoside-diphosphate reductase alpha chain